VSQRQYKRLVGVCIVAGTLAQLALIAPKSLAQAEGPALERAKEEMERGQNFYLQSRFLEAAEAFSRAFEIQPHGAFLFNSAVAYERHGDLTKAVEHFKRYLQMVPDARDKEGTQTRIKALEARLGQVTTPGAPAPPPPQAPPPSTAEANFKSLLSVKTNPEGAEILVNKGSEVVAKGVAPFDASLDDGEYRLFIRHPKFREVHEVVRVKGGKVYIMIVEMSQGRFLGYAKVTSTPPGAQVYIDNYKHGPMGKTPLNIPLLTGEHVVWVEKPGFRSEKRRLVVSIGEEAKLPVKLQRVAFGKINVSANMPNAAVYVGDKRIGQTPLENQLPPGKHHVRVEADDMKDWEGEVIVRKGQVTAVHVNFQPSVSRLGGFIVGALAVATLTVGIIAGKMTNDLENELKRERDAGTLRSDDDRMVRGKYMAIGTDGVLAIGGVLGILATYYFLRDPVPDSWAVQKAPHDFSWAPTLYGASGAGGEVRWRF